MIILNVLSDKPYPKITIERPNKEVAGLLSHVYASNESELTAIHQYSFQSMILKTEYPDIARILLEISKVEMNHLYLLGQTIHQLGSVPIFADCNFNMETYWNGFDVYYDVDLKTILEIDIESEQRAIHDYQMLKTTIKDCEIKALIERILLDEQIHLEIFLQLYKQFG